MNRAMLAGCILFSFVALSFSSTGRAALVDATWSVGTANWNTAANWAPAVIPNNGTGGNTYHVKIDNGSATNAIVNMNISPTIDLLTVTAGDTLNFNNGMDLRVEIGPIVNNGLISMNGTNSNTELLIASSISLNGSGVLQLGNDTVNRVLGVTGGPAQNLTHAATHTIRGAGNVGVNALTMTNNGLIEANQTVAMTLDLAAGANVNAGTIQATGTSTLNISDTSIDNTTGFIRALATSTVNITNSTITGGQLQADAGAAFSGTNSTLNNITLTGLLRQDNGEDIEYQGTITNNGTIQTNGLNSATEIRIHAGGATLNGTGAIEGNNDADVTNYINDNAAITPPLLINAATHTIRGGIRVGNNRVNLTNQGLIDAFQSAAPIFLDLAAGTNTNTGTIQASSTGTLNINDTVLDNTAGFIKALGTSTVNITNSTIVGGPLQADPTAAFSGNASALQGITLTGLLRHDNGEDINYGGTITNNGRIELNGLNVLTVVRVAATGVTFAGTGVIEGNNDPNVVNYIAGISAATPYQLVNTAAHTIRGGVRIGDNSLNLTNQGLIDAFQPAAPIFMDLADGTNINTGTIQASAASTLNIINTVLDNTAGFLKALGTSTVNITGSTIDGGQLQADAGAAFSGTTSTLRNITLSGLLRHDNGEVITYEGTIANNGTISLNATNASTEIAVHPNGVTFAGTGQIIMGNDADNHIDDTDAGLPPVMTNAAAHTIRGAGQLGFNAMQIVNQGTITADQTVGLAIDPDDALGMQNTGTINVIGAGGMQLVTGAFTTSGLVNVSATRTLTRTGAYTQTGGTTTVNGTLSATTGVQLQGGTLSGTGTVSGAGSLVTNAGTINPGDSIGNLNLNSGLNQTATGTISIEIGGLTPVTQHDQLSVLGSIHLDGILKVQFVNGFDPQIGNTFTVMTYPNTPLGTLGVFSSLDVPCNLPGRRVQVTITTTAVIVEIVLAGAIADINCDCVFTPQIDIPAFITAALNPAAFATNYPGCPITNADFNGDTVVNGLDVHGFVHAIVGP